jgi:hypothetical protein
MTAYIANVSQRVPPSVGRRVSGAGRRAREWVKNIRVPSEPPDPPDTTNITSMFTWCGLLRGRHDRTTSGQCSQRQSSRAIFLAHIFDNDRYADYEGSLSARWYEELRLSPEEPPSAR